MQIAFFDSWNRKFSGPIVEHLEKAGHSVRFHPTWENAKGADINFFYQADNTAIEGINSQELTGKKFVQCVDIEVWAGQATAIQWEKVDGAIFMAPHIKALVEPHVTLPKACQIIKPGIDTTKFTLKAPRGDKNIGVRKIAYVVGDHRIWDVKRLDIAFQILYDLIHANDGWRYELHIRGTYSTHEQYNAYCRYLEQDLGIKDNVVWYPERVEDMNEWLEDKDFFLLPSTKEAFSYGTAEAMAKGIKPIINNWESSKENWAPFVCNSPLEMVQAILVGNNEPEKYRKFILDNYDQERYFKELDEFLGIGGDK